MKKILLYILLAFSFVSQAQFTFKPLTGSGSGFLIAKVATVADVTIATGLEVGDVIDGVTLASGDAVLVKNQTNGIENGLYRVQPSGAALRASDMLTGTLADAKSVFVQNGSHIGVTFQQTVANCTVGTVAQTWYSIGLQSSVFRTDTVSLQVNTVTFTGFDYASVSNNAQLELQVLFEGAVINVWKDGQVGAGASLLTKTNTQISFNVANAFDVSVSTARKQTALWYLRTIKTTGFTEFNASKLDRSAYLVDSVAFMFDRDTAKLADGIRASIPAGGTVVPLTYGRVNAFVVLPSANFINTGVGTKIPFDNIIYSSGMTPSGTDGLTPSVAGRYKASWLMMNGSEEFADDGFFHVVQNGVSVGQVRYNMMEAAGVNQCAGFIDVDLVAGIPVYLHYRTAHTASDGLAWDTGSYFQLSQLPTAVAPVVNTVAEYGENNGIVNNQSTASTAFVDVTGSSFTLPSAGVWEVQYNLTSSGNSVGNRCRYQLVRASDNAVVANSSAGFVYPVANHIEHVSQKSFITTTGADVYKLQFRTDGGTLTLINANDNTGGNSKITWTKIAGQLPSTGQTVDVGYYTKPLANAALGDITGFVAQSGNIPSNGTTFNLTAGKTYELTANIEARDLDASNVVEINWVNASNVALSGSISARVEDHGTVSTDLGRSLNITLIYTPTVNESVKLSVINLTGALNIGGNVIIKQLGSTSNTVGTLPALDQSSSGYFDIGNMRMQWGTLLLAASTTSITLPTSFANANYTVVVSSAAPTNIFVTTGAKTTTNFSCTTLTNLGSPSSNNPISYYAIGQKP